MACPCQMLTRFDYISSQPPEYKCQIYVHMLSYDFPVALSNRATCTINIWGSRHAASGAARQICRSISGVSIWRHNLDAVLSCCINCTPDIRSTHSRTREWEHYSKIVVPQAVLARSLSRIHTFRHSCHQINGTITSAHHAAFTIAGKLQYLLLSF